MCDKVEDGAYLCYTDFAADLALIHANCRDYNPANDRDPRGKRLVRNAHAIADFAELQIRDYDRRLGGKLLRRCREIKARRVRDGEAPNPATFALYGYPSGVEPRVPRQRILERMAAAYDVPLASLGGGGGATESGGAGRGEPGGGGAAAAASGASSRAQRRISRGSGEAELVMLADPLPRARVRRAEASELPAGAAADPPAGSASDADAALLADGDSEVVDVVAADASAAGGDAEAAGEAGELGAAASDGGEREISDGEGASLPPAKLARAANDADVGAAAAAAAAAVSAAGVSPTAGRQEAAAASPAGAPAPAASPAAASPSAGAVAAASKAAVELAMNVECAELSEAADEYAKLKGPSEDLLDAVVGATAGWDLAQLERGRHALAALTDEFAGAHRAYMAAKLTLAREGGAADGYGGDGGGAGARPRPPRPMRGALLQQISDVVDEWRT